MQLNIGIDVGGTFTDFVLTRPGEEPRTAKVLSTPSDPSIGVIHGLSELAASMKMSLGEFAQSIATVVHGTTVTTNAGLTGTGARTGRLTTNGVAPVTVKSHLGQIRLVQGSVLGDVGAEGATLECTISSDKTSVSVTMSRDVVVDVDLIIAGY